MPLSMIVVTEPADERMNIKQIGRAIQEKVKRYAKYDCDQLLTSL